MAKKSEMCPYSEKKGYADLSWRQWNQGVLREMPTAPRVTCPTCGRRLRAWLQVCYDGCCAQPKIPPHKKKGWWKKPKKKAEKRMAPRGK